MLSILTVIKLPALGLAETIRSVDREFSDQKEVEHLLKLHGPEATPTPLPLSRIPYPASLLASIPSPREALYPFSAA